MSANRKKSAKVHLISRLGKEIHDFYEIGKLLSSEKDTMKLLDTIISNSMKITSADAGTMYLVVDTKTGSLTSIKEQDFFDKKLKFAIAKNSSMDVQLEDNIASISKDSIFGYCVISGKPLIIEDAYDLDPNLEFRHSKNYDQKTGYITRSILTIPMKNRENNITGIIQLINKKKHSFEIIDYAEKNSINKIIPFDETDVLIMNSISGQAAVAIENNLLYNEMNELLEKYRIQNEELEILSKKILIAHEEERKRIAREIHDGPAQAIVNLSFKTELCRKLLSINQQEQAMLEISNLNNSIRSVSREIRTIIYDLKPSYLDFGIFTALQNHLDSFMDTSSIVVELIANGSDSSIEYYLSSTIYRIVQESLNNISKHANATKAMINLNIQEKGIHLSIQDNGVGFDMDKKIKPDTKGGFGLNGIKERVELVKGTLSICSKKGTGTELIIFLPV